MGKDVDEPFSSQDSLYKDIIEIDKDINEDYAELNNIKSGMKDIGPRADKEN